MSLVTKYSITLFLILTLAALAPVSLAQTQNDSITLTASAPAGPGYLGASVVGAAGNTTYYYWVVAHYIGGYSTVTGPAVVPNAPNTLGVLNYVYLSWQGVSGPGVTYDVLRTTTNASPGSLCTCSVATALTVTYTSDIGAGLGAYTPGGFPYQNSAVTLQMNSRDHARPVLELILPSGAGGSVEVVNGSLASTSGSDLTSGGQLRWSSSLTDPTATKDTGLSRNAAGVVEVNNGTAGTYRDLKARNVSISGKLTGSGALGMAMDGSGNAGFDGIFSTYGALATAGRGVAVVRAVYPATGQIGTVALANLLAAAPAGLYRTSTYIHTTVAAGGACTAQVALGWTYNAGAKAKDLVAAHDLNADEGSSDNTTVIQVDAATNITRTITVAGVGCGGAQRWDITIALERVN